MILKVEHDFEQCAHIPRRKGQNHLQNHLRQNSFIKVHTPYPKSHWLKNMVNEPKQKQMLPNLKLPPFHDGNHQQKGGDQL